MSWNRWNNRKRREKAMRACESWHSDDGIDPRSFFRPKRRRDERKTRQLCGQVARVLNGVLGESGDPSLYDLMVEEVQPAPDSSHLQVIVIPMGENATATPGELLQALSRAQPMMRAEVARSIHRKRVPSLTFQIQMLASSSPFGDDLWDGFDVDDSVDLDEIAPWEDER